MTEDSDIQEDHGGSTRTAWFVGIIVALALLAIVYLVVSANTSEPDSGNDMVSSAVLRVLVRNGTLAPQIELRTPEGIAAARERLTTTRYWTLYLPDGAVKDAYVKWLDFGDRELAEATDKMANDAAVDAMADAIPQPTR